MDIKIPEDGKGVNLTYVNNEYKPRIQQTKLDTNTNIDATNTSEIFPSTPSNAIIDAKVIQSEKYQKLETENKDVASLFENNIDVGECDPDFVIHNSNFISKHDGEIKESKSLSNVSDQKASCNRKNKRKRRRGKQKSKLFKKKDNWKFQMPQRYRSNSNSTNLANMTNVLRKQIERQRSIVPYNTNRFLMEEHLAEVPSALLTPNGRTRDSSFSVDSEDNYFYSLPEDEEEFLTKEFSNVYERARVDRLEGMNKQQLIEECLQMEDRCSQIESKQHQKYCSQFMTKIKFLEEKVQRLSRENNELRRLLTTDEKKHKSKKSSNKKSSSRMCSSEDSESDSSSSSSSSSGSCTSSCSTSSISDYSHPGSPRNNKNESQNMETDDDEKQMQKQQEKPQTSVNKPNDISKTKVQTLSTNQLQLTECAEKQSNCSQENQQSQSMEINNSVENLNEMPQNVQNGITSHHNEYNQNEKNN